MSKRNVEALLNALDGSLSRSVSDIVADLGSLLELVEKWQRVQNLVSRETPGDLWQRHVLDSLQLLPKLAGARQVLDLGSGGGFPALPLATALKGGTTAFTLVESNGRKCAFLNAAKRELNLVIHVKQARIEAVSPESLPSPDVITARALASLPVLLGYARRFAGPHTRVVLHKGREYGDELAQVDSALRGSVVVNESLTDPEAVILEWTSLF